MMVETLKSYILRKIVISRILFLFLIIGFCFDGKLYSVQESPLDQLPSNISVLTHFGERAVWSPSGEKVAFVHRTLGDAFEVIVKTKEIRCLTCSWQHPGYFRIHYLSTGDYILIGPAESKDRDQARWNQSELWYLGKDSVGPPLPLGQKLNEGIAASRIAPRIAWSESSNQYPEEIPEGTSRMMVAEVEVEANGQARLVNKRQVHEDKWPHCWLEAQDFRLEDSELIYSCYQPENESEVMGVHLESGEVKNYTNSPEVYDEPEGIFPDGLHTLVECDLQNNKGDHYIDIWKLKLDGTGKDYERLTFFSDFEGYKASNPVISPDGKHMAFQIAMSKDEAGVGYGILVMGLK
jgi:hypothetical protein